MKTFYIFINLIFIGFCFYSFVRPGNVFEDVGTQTESRFADIGIQTENLVIRSDYIVNLFKAILPASSFDRLEKYLDNSQFFKFVSLNQNQIWGGSALVLLISGSIIDEKYNDGQIMAFILEVAKATGQRTLKVARATRDKAMFGAKKVTRDVINIYKPMIQKFSKQNMDSYKLEVIESIVLDGE